jgi:uncharacterized protein (TIGR02246 family)
VADSVDEQNYNDGSMSGSPGSNDETAIRDVMSSYEAALNASNTEAVIPLYAEDGVFMPPYSHSAVGKAAVRQAYDAVFKAITAQRQIHRCRACGDVVRTNSAGTNKIKATSAVSPEGNQELFIFKKGSDGKWHIARYSFSTTNPPPAA